MSVNGYRGYKHFVITSPLTGVLQVQIDSPQKLNVLHEPLWHELNAIFSQSYHDPDIRVVLLSGGGDKVLLASKNPVAMGGSKESNHVRGHIISDSRLSLYLVWHNENTLHPGHGS